MINRKIFLKLILIVTLVISSANLQAQQTDIFIRFFPSSWYNSYFEPGIDGGGIGVAYHPIMNKRVRLNISGEISALRARNEILLGFGINKTFWQAEHFRISVEANLLNGIDLYKPAPLYVGGLEGGLRFDYYVKKRLTLFIGIAARATMCPGYRDIRVWTHSSWPVTVGVRF